MDWRFRALSYRSVTDLFVLKNARHWLNGFWDPEKHKENPEKYQKYGKIALNNPEFD